jgi:hypothetical protein
MPRPNRQTGYVLALTLVMVMLAALATIGASRFALAQVRQAIDEQTSLQRRWGGLSIEQALLPAAEKVLSDEEKQTREPRASCKRTIPLGKLTFQVVLADEQAKLNVNSFVTSRQPNDAEVELRRVLSGMVPASRVVLRTGSQDFHTTVGSFGEVVDSVAPQELLESRFGLPCLAESITCWSDRRFNVFRASTESMRRGLGPLVGVSGADEIARLRSTSPRPPLPNILRKLDLPLEKRERLASFVTDHSECHSLWIISSESGYATHYRLAIQAKLREQGPRVIGFEW